MLTFRIAAVIGAVGAAGLSAQSPTPKPAKLLGLIRSESKQPIAGAEIQIVSGPGALSDSRGFFRLDSIAPGERKLVIRKVGYAPLEIAWPFSAGDSVVRVFELATIQTLDSVVTTAKPSRDMQMEAFDEHRKLGLGQFYTRADIEKSGGRISNLMAATRGVKLTYGPANQAYVQSSHGKKSLREINCYAEVYLDEMNIYTKRTSGSPPPFDINSIPSSQIEAIEYFAGPGETPARYQKMGTACGVLVIHTRRP